jgi:zinc transport system ATP-binding protein
MKMVLMSPSVTPVARVTGASIGYGDRAVLVDVDFRLDPGEIVALVGPNGAGKTTLVRGLLGLAPVLDGEIELLGVPSARFRERYRIGYVPQRHTVGGAIPSTVQEVVASGRLPRTRWWRRRSGRDRAVVAEAIATVGLSGHAQAPVSTLSGGQQRRALIARALAAEPDVLIMDEPTAGVDAENQANLVRTLADLVASGLTMLVVTHEITALRPVLTRVVTIEGGRVVRDEPVENADPGHECNDCGHDDVLRDPASGQRQLLGSAGIG